MLEKLILVFVLTEGGGEGHAAVFVHLRGSSGGVQDP